MANTPVQQTLFRLFYFERNKIVFVTDRILFISRETNYSRGLSNGPFSALHTKNQSYARILKRVMKKNPYFAARTKQYYDIFMRILQIIKFFRHTLTNLRIGLSFCVEDNNKSSQCSEL